MAKKVNGSASPSSTQHPPPSTLHPFQKPKLLVVEDDETLLTQMKWALVQDNEIKEVGLGAYDFFSKPIITEELKVVLNRAFYLSQLEHEHRELQDGLRRKSFEEMIGTGPQMQEVFASIRKVATTEVPVLIVGESGTGKELVAKAIHANSSRRKCPFIVINCSAIPEALLESELFGHEKGAFTGAHIQRKGRFAMAQ